MFLRIKLANIHERFYLFSNKCALALLENSYHDATIANCFLNELLDLQFLMKHFLFQLKGRNIH